MTFVYAFMVGGALCAVAQLVMDLTNRTPAQILVGGVVAGAIIAGFGLYEPLVNFAGAGASIPLTGFGYALVRGVLEDLQRTGWLGLFTGAFKATAAGIKAAIVFAILVALTFRARA